ncbi:MAG: hypothetical protein KGL39_21360 [Patescibacteria group bacterium]|nr:hypothetical protein [Patescibacteria group bacterium]
MERERNRLGPDLEVEEAARMMAEPAGYARLKLGLELHPKQAAVLTDLFKTSGSRVCFRCGNEVGKTSHVAAPAILYALDVLNAQAVSTAGVWMQVTKQLVPNLKQHSAQYPGWRFLEAAISIGNVDRYVGFSTRDEGFAQGFHRQEGRPLLAIIDEAAAVRDVVFNGVEDRCNPDWFLVMGSPLDPSGRFYDIETKLAPYYSHHSLGQPECTTEDGYWIEPATIERKIAKWGSKEHPFILSNVFGQFGQRVAYALLSLGEFDGCLNNPPPAAGLDRHAFIDFAAGRNKNVFAVRVGNRTWIAKKWAERNTMAAVGEIVATFHKLHREIGLQAEEVEGDNDGLGKPIIDRLHEVGLPIGRFHGGAKPRFSNDYANAISEAWGEGSGKVIKKDHIIPDDPDFKAQALTRQIKRNSSGKMQLESKEDLAKRGLESPDEADAIFCAMMPGPILRSVNLGGLAREEVGGFEWRERQAEEASSVLPGADCS